MRLAPLDRVRLRGDLVQGTVYAVWCDPNVGWCASVDLDNHTIKRLPFDSWVLVSTEHGPVANSNPDNTIQSLLNFE